MKNNFKIFIVALISLITLSSHNLFIKLESYYLEPESETLFHLYNGTFGTSEAVLDRKRMLDVSLINPGEKSIHPDKGLWYEANNQTILKVKTGKEGTGVIGISTLPRTNNFTPERFIDNMKHEGLLEVLEARKKSGEDKKPVDKKYSNHVKAIFQIGNHLSEDYKTVLGYPIEFIPKTNPYALEVGDEFTVKLLIDGKPVAGVKVYASYNDKFGNAKDGTPLDIYQLTTNKMGEVTAKITNAGHWYFRTVHLVKSTEKDADYISISANLTFELE